MNLRIMENGEWEDKEVSFGSLLQAVFLCQLMLTAIFFCFWIIIVIMMILAGSV